MPAPSKRTLAGRVKAAKHSRNEYSEFGPMSAQTKDAGATEHYPSDPLIVEIARSCMELVSPEISTRGQRSIISGIGKHLAVLSSTLTDAELTKAEGERALTLAGKLISQIPLPPSDREQQFLGVLSEVNAERQGQGKAALSNHLLKKKLLSVAAQELTAVRRALRAALENVSRLKEKTQQISDSKKTQRRARDRAKEKVAVLRSPEHERAVTERVVFDNIKHAGEYTETAKAGISQLALHTRSLRSAPAAFLAALQVVLPSTDPATLVKIVPVRASITQWTDVAGK